MKHLWSVLVCLVLPAQVFAASTCPPIPYAIKLKQGAIEVNAEVYGNAVKQLEGANVTAGFGVIRTAYSAMAQQAFGDVLTYYTCTVGEHINSQTHISDGDKKKQVAHLKAAKASIVRTAALYFAAFASGDTKAQREYSADIEATIRKATDPAIDPRYIDDSIGKIDVERTFIETRQVDAFVQAKVAAGEISACGGVALESIVKNADSIQRVVASAREILRTYLDASDEFGKQVALSDLFMQASTATQVASPPSNDRNFRNCSDSLKQRAVVASR